VVVKTPRLASLEPRFQGKSSPDNQVFLNSFLISISAFPGNLWTIFHMDKLGRKFFLGKQITGFAFNPTTLEFITTTPAL
jgi:hypothetical protein